MHLDRQALVLVPRDVNSVVFKTFHTVFHLTFLPLHPLGAFRHLRAVQLTTFSVFLEDLLSGYPLFFKCSVQTFHDFMVNVSPVGTKPSGETSWNVQELMNDGLFLLLFTQPVIPFRYDFDCIGGWKVERLLPYPPETMDSSNGALRCGSPAPDAKNELRNDMEKVQAVCDFVSQSLNIWSVGIFDGHSPHRSPCQSS